MRELIQAVFSLNLVGLVLWAAWRELRILLRTLRDGTER